MSIETSEQVLCLPSALCDEFCREGFTPAIQLTGDGVRLPGWCYRPRSEAETDETHRHIVTYTVLRSWDCVFRYRRGKSGSESRLHDRLSIGVGGHVNQQDIGSPRSDHKFSELIREAAMREVLEEVDLGGQCTRRFLGLLKGGATSVDRVHLGVVFEIMLGSPTATAREDCLADAAWVPVEQVRRERERLESWSRMLVEAGLV